MSLKRLLCVDDEPEQLEILSEYFAGRYEVSVALSGEVALERFTRERPDAVFLDINMPGMDGVEVLRRLREVDRSVAVVMVTANTDVAIAEECLKGGALGYVPKPYNLKYMDHMAAMATDHR